MYPARRDKRILLDYEELKKLWLSVVFIRGVRLAISVQLIACPPVFIIVCLPNFRSISIKLTG